MGIFNWLMHRNMKKEAKRLAGLVAIKYPKSKAKHLNSSEQEIIMGMAFDKNKMNTIPESSRNRIKICCKTVNGFCYMMALDTGAFKNMINLRSLQFTTYMDQELILRGFPAQTKAQKARILDVMELKIEGWDRITGD